MKEFIVFLIVLSAVISPVSAAWNYIYQNPVANASRPYVYTLNISNNTAFFGNTTHINVTCWQKECGDLRVFAGNDTTNPMPYWIENNITSTRYTTIYINLTTNTTSYQIYTGSTGLNNFSDPGSTFKFFANNLTGATINSGTWVDTQGFINSTSDGSIKIPSTWNSGKWEYDAFLPSNTFHVVGTMTNGNIDNGYQIQIDPNALFYGVKSPTSGVFIQQPLSSSFTGWFRVKLVRNSTGTMTLYGQNSTVGRANDNSVTTSTFIVPRASASGYRFKDIRVSQYVDPEPVWANWVNITTIPPAPTPTPLPPRVPFTPSNCGIKIVTDLQNMAPQFSGEIAGTGARVSGVKYWSNDSSVYIMVLAHANTVSQTAEIELQLNDTPVAITSGKPLGGAEESNKSIDVIIPRYSNYTVTISNFHHYEWRESNTTLDISGCTYPQNNTSLNNVIQGISIGIGFIFGLIVSVAACKKHMDDHLNKFHRRQ